jgi:hypothetical protein
MHPMHHRMHYHGTSCGVSTTSGGLDPASAAAEYNHINFACRGCAHVKSVDEMVMAACLSLQCMELKLVPGMMVPLLASGV